VKLLLDACVWGGAKKFLEGLWAGEWLEDPGDREILNRAHAVGLGARVQVEMQ
jgi:hypothetical protein